MVSTAAHFGGAGRVKLLTLMILGYDLVFRSQPNVELAFTSLNIT